MKRTLLLASLLLSSLSAFAAETAPTQAEALKAHFGDDLHDNQGNKVDLARLNGKAVGIYYSAHWCPPCRAFTPTLVDYRNKYAENLEVVFVSADRDDESMKKYIEEARMPWLTVTRDGEIAKALSEKYEVTGIPTLVILKSDGSLLTRDGRSLVASGADGTLLNDPKARIETSEEEYNCGKCNKTHTRKVTKLVKGDKT